MPTLRIALHDGFDNESVVITVNGTQVFRREGVSRTTSQLAAQHEMTVDEGPVKWRSRCLSANSPSQKRECHWRSQSRSVA